MNNKKATKRALLTSVMALVMCVVMLVGTTFAWFTDTASTGVNKIVAGNLDIKLFHTVGSEVKELTENDTLQWKTEDTGDVLWEPNCTYDLEEFQIKNAGNLAVKYKVVLKATNIAETVDGKSLLDVIDWTVKVNGDTVKKDVLLADLGADKGTIIIEGEKLTAGENAKVTVTGHMKAEAGNDYQRLKIDGFGITVYAAQVNHESDSFGTSYDVTAPYDSSAPKTPLVVSVGTKAELEAALTSFAAAGAGDNVINLTQNFEIKDGETWTSASINGYQGAGVITINGNGHTIKGLNAPLLAGGFAGKAGVIINNLTLDSVKINDTKNNQGIGAFIGCIDSMPTIELNGCKLTNSTITSTGGARVGGLIGWTSGYNNPNDGPVNTYITIKNCSVENCEITAKGSVGAIIGHAGANPATYHTIESCTVSNTKLNSTDDGGWRVGVVVGTANVGEVTITGTTSSGNTLTQADKTAPDGQSDLYGRFVPGTTGKLTINGTKVNG